MNPSILHWNNKLSLKKKEKNNKRIFQSKILEIKKFQNNFFKSNLETI